MRVIGLAGWSGAGKTTLLVRLIPELARRGVAVSTVKHAHHAFDLDRPGKDSHAHREAGAREVLVTSAARFALLHELRGEPEPPLDALLGRLSPVDLVLVEGFKADRHPRIEVRRAARGGEPLFGRVPGIVALATDDLGAAEPGLPVRHLDDVSGIADLALAFAVPVDALRTAA